MSISKQAIGFANKFYTLWSIDTQPVYTVDSYGKHWLTGYNTRYTYHKNISFDLEKAKVLYPNLEVLEDLKGKTTSWVSENKDDLCPHIMKFGKYFGKDINDLLDLDFSYLIWLCTEGYHSSNREYVKNLPRIKEYFKNLEDIKNKSKEDAENTFIELVKEGSYTFIPERNLKLHDDFAYISVDFENDLRVEFKFERGSFVINTYNGFEYGLPLVKDKPKRMKGKNVTFEFIKDESELNTLIVTNLKIF